MENARLNERVLEQEKVRRDIALATEVQKGLLPEGAPQTEATSFGAFTLAARNVGGDYYDFFQAGEHRIGIALAQVAGQGIAAAISKELRAWIAIAPQHDDLTFFVMKMNELSPGTASRI